MEKPKQIIIADRKNNVAIFGNLKLCPICKINYSALTPCVMCSMRLDEEKKKGRPLTREELDELFSWLE